MVDRSSGQKNRYVPLYAGAPTCNAPTCAIPESEGSRTQGSSAPRGRSAPGHPGAERPP
jgi:hypothetical protein